MEHAASQRSSMFALLVLAVKGGLCWVSQMYVRAQTDGCPFLYDSPSEEKDF